MSEIIEPAFDPEKFLSEDDNEKFGNALIANKEETFEDVFKLTFPELFAKTSKEDLEEYKEFFLEDYDVHECDGCADWNDDDDLEDGYCSDCVEINYDYEE